LRKLVVQFHRRSAGNEINERSGLLENRSVAGVPESAVPETG
jgi:hypothetical protein